MALPGKAQVSYITTAIPIAYLAYPAEGAVCVDALRKVMRRVMESIRVMIIDEHPLFRMGVRYVVEQSGKCTLVAETPDANQGLEIARANPPDVVLIDSYLISGNPLELARQLRHFSPQVAIIFLTDQEEEEQLFQSIKVGAAAYLL